MVWWPYLIGSSLKKKPWLEKTALMENVVVFHEICPQNGV